MAIVTFTTDFGASDYFVGAMKGALLTVNEAAKIVDITHEIQAHDVRAGAFALFAAHDTFPLGTIHVAVVDPGVGSARRAIVATADDHIFVAPDNGLLTLIYKNAAQLNVYELTNDRFFRHPVSRTFHGRDIFAPVAGALSRGVLPIELGEEITDFVEFEFNQPQRIREDVIETEILQIDRFGNCLVNLRRADVPPEFWQTGFRLEINGREIARLQNFYAETAVVGSVFMIFGSADFLELVAFRQSAAELLDARVGQPLLVKQKQN